MSSPTIFKQLGSKAKDYWAGVKALPVSDTDIQGLKESAQNVSGTAPTEKKQEPAPSPAANKDNPLTRYGSRPGEVRYNVDKSGEITPEPVYDGGGDVKKEDAHIEKKAQFRPIIHESMTVNTGKPSSSLPPLTPPIVPQPKAFVAQEAPVYDNGGDVDVNDGKHQVAVLQDGEKVLTPAEANQYKQEHPEEEHGAPADFPGRVLPNPTGIKPMLDTERETPVEPVGAKMNIDNAALNEGERDKDTFPTASEQEASVKALRPYSEVAKEKAEAQAKVQSPVAPTTTSDVTGQIEEKPVEEKPKATYGQGLAQDWLKKIGASPAPTTTSEVAENEVQPRTQPAGMNPIPNMGQEKAGGPLTPMGAQPTSETPREQRDLAGMERKARLADYDQRIQAAQDQGTPQGHEEALRLKQAKDTYELQHPRFTGPLGSVLHGLSKAGNIAGDILAPGIMTAIPGTDLNKAIRRGGLEKQVEGAAKATTERESEENKPSTAKVLTNPEQVYKDLMTGDNGNPRRNPDTKKPFTSQEANVAAQGTGKTPEELYIQEQMRSIDLTTGKHLTRAQAEERYLQMKAGNKPPNEEERRVNDYIASHGQQDTPVNRESARTALKASDTTATQQAALPFAEQKAKFNDSLATTRALLVQQNADANQRGLKADELQNTENTRSAGVLTKITTAKDALNATDEQFANQIVPVVTLLSVTSAEGVKRVNKQELDKFVPTSGSLGRWIEGHVDQWLSGQIPTEYRTEVGHMLDRMEAAEDTEHRINTQSIDSTVRQGAQQPVQKPKGGAKATPAPSKPAAAPAKPTPPKGATNEVYKSATDKTVIGHMVNGRYVPLAPPTATK